MFKFHIDLPVIANKLIVRLCLPFLHFACACLSSESTYFKPGCLTMADLSSTVLQEHVCGRVSCSQSADLTLSRLHMRSMAV